MQKPYGLEAWQCMVVAWYQSPYVLVIFLTITTVNQLHKMFMVGNSQQEIHFHHFFLLVWFNEVIFEINIYTFRLLHFESMVISKGNVKGEQRIFPWQDRNNKLTQWAYEKENCNCIEILVFQADYLFIFCVGDVLTQQYCEWKWVS